MAKMGDDSFAELKKKEKVSNDPRLNEYVRCLSIPLLKAAGHNPANWEIRVFVNNTPNAFALPGNNIGVHTGMINLVQNQHQLAAVIGHEIGHVIADHGNERVSQNMATQAGLFAASLFLGTSAKPEDRLILAGLGLGAQVGILLPFSRSHEEESDKLGIQYMAQAGFDPREASKLWEVMKAKSKGGGPEFLSTHPSNDSRIKYLRKYAQKFMATYQAAPVKPLCHL